MWHALQTRLRLARSRWSRKRTSKRQLNHRGSSTQRISAFENLESRILLAADVQFRFEFADLSGTPVSSLQVGQDFQLRVHIQDLRRAISGGPAGLFQVHIDLRYDLNEQGGIVDLVTPTGPVVPGEEYASFASPGPGIIPTGGLLDEAGGLDTDSVIPDLPNNDQRGDEFLLFSVPFRADNPGTLFLTPDDAALPTFRFGQPIILTVENDFVFQNQSIEIEAGTVVVTPTSGLTTSEDGNSATFEIVLGQQPTADVTIGLSSSNATEGTLSDASVTFSSTNWNIAKTITVTGQDDDRADGDIVYSIVTTATSSGDIAFDGIAVDDVSLTNTDNDTAGFTVTVSGGSTEVSESGTTDTFNVVLTAQPLSNVVLTVSSDDEGEATVDQSTLTFTPNNWDTAQTVKTTT